MKKILLVLAVLMCGVFTQAQTIIYPEGDILLYSDTSILVDGSELILSLYGSVPIKISNDIYSYTYRKVYLLDGEVFKTESPSYITYPNEQLTISGVQRTYDWMYPLVVTVDVANWKIASWQTYLQKIHNQ